PALPTGTGGDDRVAPSAAHAGVADLIPHLRAGSPALSPSVAPALGPVEVEPAPITEPDATRPIEPVAPQSQAVPAGLLPPASPRASPHRPAPPPPRAPHPPPPPRPPPPQCCPFPHAMALASSRATSVSSSAPVWRFSLASARCCWLCSSSIAGSIRQRRP